MSFKPTPQHVANRQAVLDKIHKDPGSWDQENWHSGCGTAHCFGGWAQLLAGKEAKRDMTRFDARIFLGLSDREASYYFDEARTLEELEECVNIPDDDYDTLGLDYEGYDREGYNRYRDGYDRDGYDRDGYDRDGHDREGYNRAGYSRTGYNREGYNKYGYDRGGYDKDGYDVDDLDGDLQLRPTT